MPKHSSKSPYWLPLPLSIPDGGFAVASNTGTNIGNVIIEAETKFVHYNPNLLCCLVTRLDKSALKRLGVDLVSE